MASPSPHPPSPKLRSVPKTAEPLHESDLIYLQTLLDDPTNRDAALVAAGHVITEDNAKRSMHSKILQRIDQAENIADLFRQVGLGPSKLALKLNWLYAQENPRSVGLAAKLHMDILTADQAQQSHGTPIQVNVMQQNGITDIESDRPQLIRVEVNAIKPRPQQDGENKVCNKDDGSIES